MVKLILLLNLTACQQEKTTFVWEKIAFPSTHQLHDIHFINKDTGYVCGGIHYYEASIHQTVDGGQNWTEEPIVGNSILFDLDWPTAQKGFSVGLGNKILSKALTDSIWHLNQQHFDCGSWLPVYSLDFWKDSLGLAVGGSGYDDGVIFRTTDGGISWNFQCFDREFRDVLFTAATTAYATAFGGIYKTIDSGESWFPLDIQGDFFMAIDFPSQEVGYAVGNQGIIVKTTTAGHNWQVVKKIKGAFQQRDHFTDVVFVDEEKGYVIGYHTFQVTEDGGVTWKEVEGIDFEKFRSIKLTENKEGFIVGDNGSIIKFIE